MSYSRRVNRVVDYVRNHLDQDLSLETLARVAHFSPYHFHRIFKTTTGETLVQFSQRARLERAAYLMKASPERELGSIALEPPQEPKARPSKRATSTGAAVSYWA